MLLRTMPWKHKLSLIGLSIMIFTLCTFGSNSIFLLIKSFLFSLILMIASYFDIKTRIIPNWIHILLIIIGLIEFDLVRSMSGLLFAPLPFIIMVLIEEGSIGGGDVKLIGVIGFLLGLKSAWILVFVSLLIAILYNILYYYNKDGIRNLSFPFVPFILFGWIVMKIEHLV